MEPTPNTLETMAAILDGLDVAMCAFDRDDRTLLWNRAFLRYFPEHANHVFAGEPYQENLRRFYTGRLDEKELVDIERFIADGIARHRAQLRPYTFRHRDSWLRVSSLPLSNGGRVRVWRREGKRRLSDTEENSLALHGVADSREIFEHMGDGVMLTDSNNCITWVNENFVDMFELSNKDVAVEQHVEAVYSAIWKQKSAPASAAFETGEVTLRQNLLYAGSPFELPLPGGRWVRIVEQRRRDGVGFFALTDISVLKRQQQELIAAEREARESQARLAEKSVLLQATLERMEQGVMMVNAQGIVEVCNRRAMELLDLPASLMVTKPTTAQVVDYQWSINEFAEAPDALRQIASARQISTHALRYERTRPNGLVIEVQNVPIEGGGVLRSYTDITERKKAEATQRALESQLREAQKLEAIGTLAGGIAHDFNNIIAAVLGNAAMAEEAAGPENPAQMYLGQISKAGLRARSLVQQILAFSRKQTSEFGSVSVRALVEETDALLRTTLDPSFQLVTDIPEQTAVVKGDATQLQQVLMNLGTNALQAMHGRRGRIEVGFETLGRDDLKAAQAPVSLEPGEYVRLWVRDEGCGMDRSTRERIFEPFFTTKPVGVGTGLGLAVAHGIVEAHGGEIAVQSVVDGGTTFSVYLPLAMPESGLIALDTITQPEPRGDGEHVLYVDDDEVMAVMVLGLLRKLGYRATCVIDPREAISLVKRNPSNFDIVVSDFNMPHMTGLDLARAIAAIRPHLPFAISSGYISDELRDDAAAMGISGLMQKERTLEDLGALVQAALRSL